MEFANLKNCHGQWVIRNKLTGLDLDIGDTGKIYPICVSIPGQL